MGDGSLAVIVLAAGQGTRMKSGTNKVLHEIAGRPMLAYPLEAAAALEPAHCVVVVGRDAARVEEAFRGRATFVTQEEQRGTGHAVSVALPALGAFRGQVLILYGDVPLLRPGTLLRLRAHKEEAKAPLAMLTAPIPLPGLVVRGPSGQVERIVEVTDATPEELTIREGNTGVYLVDAELLAKTTSQLDDRNEQGELYLTDMVAVAHRAGLAVAALCLEDADEALGVNTRGELAHASAVQYRRNAERWMEEGVTFLDPQASYVDTDARIGRDSVIEPGVMIRGESRLGERVRVKAQTVIESSEIGDDAVLGPSAHLRPGCRLGRGVRIGNFVEVKNSSLGDGVKADHLSYIGDADVGEGSSFGCGAITVNYDWEAKHRTRIGSGVRVGCNANLIAPLSLADGAVVAAGSTLTKDVPAGALAVERGAQRVVAGWAERRTRGRPSPGAGGGGHEPDDG